MLHELFLLLAGNPSPLLTPDGLPKDFPLVSTSERELLETLATLGHLHISLRHACQTITTLHRSTIARAVAGGIETHHLQAFRARILEVEESILRRDVGIVGGYDIVSLAKVLSGFEGWERTLRYLHDLVEYIAPGSGTVKGTRGDGDSVSGADIVNRLRNDIFTGYPTLEVVALHLLNIAEMAWLREASTWVLYGRLPSAAIYGSGKPSTDFFIKEEDSDLVQDTGGAGMKEYHIVKKLLPAFVTQHTASSLLFIGRALSMIRLRGGAGIGNTAAASPQMTLLPRHLEFLQSLESPLSPQKLSNAIANIRLSLSRHTLQTLLPAEKILDTVHVLREFFLLGRGEFAVSIIEQADERTRNSWRPQSVKPSKGPLVKEGEVAAVLTRTWGFLSSLQGEEVVDERLDTARDLIYLSLHTPPAATPSSKKVGENFRNILVGVPVSLNFHLSWPLELFLQPADLEEYDALFAYLISIRKTQMKLQSLWKGRRNPMQRTDKSRTENREEAKGYRETLKARDAAERNIWATAGVAVFFLETLVDYWQGEVVEGAFSTLVEIISPQKPDDGNESEEDSDIWTKVDEASEAPSRIDDEEAKQQDPESLMRAHHAYLDTIKRNLFVTDIVFAPLIKQLLHACDLLAGAVGRLISQHTFEDLNIQELYVQDAQRTYDMVQENCAEVRALLRQLVGRLQRIDEERDGWTGDDIFAPAASTTARPENSLKVDRLLMRMDLGNL